MHVQSSIHLLQPPHDTEQVSEYLAALQRVEAAVQYFRENNAEHPELGSLARLRTLALRALEMEYLQTLERHAGATSASELLALPPNDLGGATLIPPECQQREKGWRVEARDSGIWRLCSTH